MTTQESELGTLEWVNDLRDAWKHEAHNLGLSGFPNAILGPFGVLRG